VVKRVAPALIAALAIAAAAVQTIRLGHARSQATDMARAMIARCNSVHEMFESAREAHDAGKQDLAVDLFQHNAGAAIFCSLDHHAMQDALRAGDVAKILELVPIRDKDDVDTAVGLSQGY
jgi:hypothetical protein